MNIVITGTSRGIGLSLAKYYTELGHKVFGCSRSDSAFENENYVHFCVDLTNESEITKFSHDVKNGVGGGD